MKIKKYRVPNIGAGIGLNIAKLNFGKEGAIVYMIDLYTSNMERRGRRKDYHLK
jgi:hypothetical protein